MNSSCMCVGLASISTKKENSLINIPVGLKLENVIKFLNQSPDALTVFLWIM